MRPSIMVIAAAVLPACLIVSATAAEGPVKIGVLNDQNSVYSVDGGLETVVAVRMAVEDVGPVLGHQVEVVAADHQKLDPPLPLQTGHGL